MPLRKSLTAFELYTLHKFASPALHHKVTRDDSLFEQGGASVHELVYQDAQDMIPPSVLNRAPTSPRDLVTQFSTILSPDAISAITENLSSFDSIAGIQCSEAFIAERSIGAWLQFIIESVFVNNAQQPVVGQFDGTDDRDMFGTPESNSGNGAIQQIDLVGRTLLDGWTAHNTTRQLSGLRAGQQLSHDPMMLNATWTPAQPGSNFVYHGTASHYYRADRWPDQFEETPFNALSARQNINQLAPEDAGPVVFTTVSPLRAFLWAAFTSHLPANIPDRAVLSHMQKPWTARGRSYRGIVVFQFTSRQPAPQGLSCYVIRSGLETRWGQKSIQSGRGDIPRGHAWQSYREIHGQDGMAWPDLVHGLEYGSQRTQLTASHTNMWRTAHKDGPALDQLNAGHRGTYAISFMQSDRSSTQPSASTKPGPTKDDKGNDGKGGRKHGQKFGTVGKAYLKMKKSIRNIFAIFGCDVDCIRRWGNAQCPTQHEHEVKTRLGTE